LGNLTIKSQMSMFGYYKLLIKNIMYEEDVAERPREIGDRPMMEESRPMMEESRPTGNDVDMVKQDYRSKQETLRDYEINIRFLSVGCIVSVGCRQIPFTNVGDAMVEVNKYVQNPNQERERWYKIFDSAE